MPLLERDADLDLLGDHFRAAAAGRGRLIFLGGEAGVGKSMLVEEFARRIETVAPVAMVSCESDALPGPFSGLHDLADALGSEIAGLLREQASRERIVREFYETLRQAPSPNVVIGEDSHHTDEASLELIRFIGRRIGQTQTLFIVTYREDAMHPRHPLRVVMGDLVNAPDVYRMSVSPLTLNAVHALARESGLDAGALHERTGGNSFYVTEIIEGGGNAIPATIQDAVLARVARLSIDARTVLDAAAVIGIVVDSELLEAVIGAPIETELEECLASGVLRTNADAVQFRHALTRDVLYESISPSRRRGLHRRIFETLEEQGSTAAGAATLAHHADRARLADRVQCFALMAADYAARLGAHREAAAQLARALSHAEGLPPAELAALLEARSYECYLTGRLDDAIADCQRAIALRRDAGDPVRVGDNLRALSRYLWFSGRGAEATARASEALELLEPLASGPELAMAYSNISQLRMLAYDSDEAIRWGERAISLARELDHQPILAHALTNVGSALSFSDFDAGRALIEEAVSIARACGLHDDVVRALTNLGWTALEQYDLQSAERYISEGIAFTVEHDIIGMELYLRGSDCRVLLAKGQWIEAEEKANAILERPGLVASSRIVANMVLGQVRTRLGGDGSGPLEEALLLAEQTGELQRLGPVRAARAEAAWLAGDPELAAAEAAHVSEDARQARLPWLAGNLALWMHRGGRAITDLTGLAEPFALEIAGCGEEAAELWRARGHSLEMARALASTGAEVPLRSAHVVFDQLNARPDLARTVNALRAAGATQIPRGPRAETRANAAGLTARELDVLALLIEGRTNREIADQLFLSHRTVGHHVSAILGKLEIESREDACERAVTLGLSQGRSPIGAK